MTVDMTSHLQQDALDEVNSDVVGKFGVGHLLALLRSTGDGATPGRDLRNNKPNTKRKRSKSGIYLDTITRDQLLDLTHLPTEKAAKVLGIGTTSFKRVCRRHHIETWPYKCYMVPEKFRGSSEPESVELTTTSDPTMNMEERRLVDLATQDVRNIANITFSDETFATTESIQSLSDTVKLSQSMRSACGVSIFNDGVLLKLLDRLSAPLEKTEEAAANTGNPSLT